MYGNRQYAIEKHIGLTQQDADFLNANRQLPVCRTLLDLLRLQMARTEHAGMALLRASLVELRKEMVTK